MWKALLWLDRAVDRIVEGLAQGLLHGGIRRSVGLPAFVLIVIGLPVMLMVLLFRLAVSVLLS